MRDWGKHHGGFCFTDRYDLARCMAIASRCEVPERCCPSPAVAEVKEV